VPVLRAVADDPARGAPVARRITDVPESSNPPAHWLVLDDRVLATLEVAGSARSRSRGLLGRDGIDGALLLRPARSVHTFGMRFPIDVAHVDGDLRVLRICTMVPNRLGRPLWSARAVIECEAGAFAAWGVCVGDQLELR
jgi:uncharacterized membrane protein (UPF0127 family)